MTKQVFNRSNEQKGSKEHPKCSPEASSVLFKFGENLRDLRKSIGLNQKEFATGLNISPHSLSNYESGSHAMDIYTLYSIATKYGVSTDTLLEVTPNDPLAALISIKSAVSQLESSLLNK